MRPARWGTGRAAPGGGNPGAASVKRPTGALLRNIPGRQRAPVDGLCRSLDAVVGVDPVVDRGLLLSEDQKIGVKAIMSLSGQWVARYTGANSGTIVIEMDEVGDHYEGVACAWDDDPSHPNSLVRFRTASKTLLKTIPGLQVVPMDRRFLARSNSRRCCLREPPFQPRRT